ncbi:hypothetical protein ABG067_002050 [Albugo candida]
MAEIAEIPEAEPEKVVEVSAKEEEQSVEKPPICATVDDHEVEICIREELKQLVIRDIVLYSSKFIQIITAALYKYFLNLLAVRASELVAV